ncbi:hypothetical protein [Parasedimentitalea huanghaiensis]|uniref:Lipoprotein n=1 Tax=Parasedimentitalea huanghaiensis TaxID=2682100 RepID=A0A6L6WLZ7_9RHOB|nr:hypothetical protein [Zongyanglinia huanghaiensis]MVO17645.1 hypothetical protein [Zongyanglinia huanghaiensis]
MIRLIAFLASLSLLTACGETLMDEAQEDLGAFKMRVGYIYTDKALQWPLSRNAEGSDWNADLQNALDTRLRRYEGTQEYDVAITLEGFMLAPAGVPIVLSPKSVAVVNVFVYDVAGQEYLAKKHQMEIFESTTGESALLGSGHSRTKEEQIAGLSLNIVDAVEEWIAEQHLESGWFDERVENVEEDPAAPS